MCKSQFLLEVARHLRWSQFLSSSGQVLVSTDGPTFSGLMTASSVFTRALLIVWDWQGVCAWVFVIKMVECVSSRVAKRALCLNIVRTSEVFFHESDLCQDDAAKHRLIIHPRQNYRPKCLAVDVHTFHYRISSYGYFEFSSIYLSFRFSLCCSETCLRRLLYPHLH